MPIDFYCSSICGSEKQIQLAGCGIVVIFTDSYNRISSREYGFALGNSPHNLADLQVVRLALTSIQPPFRDEVAIIYISSNYLIDVLCKTLSSNEFVREVQEVRKWASYYGDLSITDEAPVNDNTIKAAELANIAMITQEHYDSDTITY